jgi:hypothetical protein
MNPLEEFCPVCQAKPGEICRNPVTEWRPLPGRAHHIARSETHHYCAKCAVVHEDGKCGR